LPAVTGFVLLGIAAGLWWGCARQDRRPTWEAGAAPPNVVLITVESLRTDHIGCYRGTRPTSPNIDRLAREAIVYDRAHAVTSWTLASHASIFTGLYPAAHQAVGSLDTLGDAYTTLAETLYERGYQCGGVVSGPYLTKRYGLQQGFDYYDESPSAVVDLVARGDVTNDNMTAGVRRFLESRETGRPFLLFAYYWDPHHDYIPPSPYNETFVKPEHEFVDVTQYEGTNKVHAGISGAQLDYVRSQYDGEILWTDVHLGRLFDLLREHGVWDDTVIILTADHGEEFFDHGHKGHKHNLYDETVHVPLIIKFDQGRLEAPKRDGRLVSHVDLLPTILDLTGSPPPSEGQGYSLLDEPPPDRVIFFDLYEVWFTWSTGEQTSETRQWYGVRQGDYKLVTVPDGDLCELYYVAADRGEKRDLAPEASRREQVEELAALINEYRSASASIAGRYPRGEQASLSAEEIERLRSLGYVR
jgi:arylsulfatase A-like enzyme